MEPMAPREIDYYKAKYRFQWWWYSHGGKVLVENALGAMGLGLLIYEMWLLAYLMEP